jgi:hypothetical protein
VKTQIKFFVYWSGFSLIVAAVYWFLSYEVAGSFFLLFMFIAPLMIGAYLAFHGLDGTPPEDDPQAEYKVQAGVTVGRFYAESAWPILMAAGIAIGLEGFVYGKWLLAVGVVLFVGSIIGLMAESRG